MFGLKSDLDTCHPSALSTVAFSQNLNPNPNRTLTLDPNPNVCPHPDLKSQQGPFVPPGLWLTPGSMMTNWFLGSLLTPY